MDKLLKNDLILILSDPSNVVVTTGSVSGNSIEVQHKKESVYQSYLYRNNIEARDKDIIKLISLLKEKAK